MRRAFDLVLLFAGLAVLWQVLHIWAGDVALPSPLATFAHLGKMLGQARFWPHVRESLLALAYAWVIAGLAGLGMGVALGANKLAGEVMEPVLVALYAIPKVTLYPLVLLIFGLGLSAKVCFGAIHGVIPVAIFALNAVRNIRPVHVRAARTMGLGPWAMARRVLLPAALPEIVSGQRIGFSLTLLGVLIGEMFASQRGLGFLITNAITLNDTLTIMAVSLLLFIFAGVINALLLAIDQHLHRRAAV